MNVLFEKIKIQPIELNTDMFDDFANLYGFSDKSDFILKDNIEYIGVCLTVSNTTYGERGRNAVAHRFTAEIYDDTAATVIASSNFTIAMSPWQDMEDARVDIPLTESKVDILHDYTVRIVQRVHGHDPHVFIDKPFRFFRTDEEPFLSMEPKCGYALVDGIHCRSICREDAVNTFTQVAFEFENKIFPPERFPELCISTHTAEGLSGSKYVKCEPIPGTDRLLAITPITFYYGNVGPAYAELRIFGRPLGGFVFNADAPHNQEGEFQEDELAVEPCFIPSEYISFFEHQNSNSGNTAAREVLDRMIGLDDVKSKIMSTEQMVRFNIMRRNAGLPSVMPPLHAMFLGSPGTGKTTVAKIMGELMHEAGALSSGHLVVRERSTLLGQFYSSEAEKTLEALEQAKGGILFIDEAYQLYQPNDPKDPGRHVIDTLLSALADENNRDWMLILAGYTQPMLDMFKMNPGLASRIPESNRYFFSDYSPKELCEIATTYIETNKYSLDDDARKAVTELLRTDYNNRTTEFGNARHVVNIIQTGIIPAMARRLANCQAPTIEDLTVIHACDIPQPMKPATHKRNNVGFDI